MSFDKRGRGPGRGGFDKRERGFDQFEGGGDRFGGGGGGGGDRFGGGGAGGPPRFGGGGAGGRPGGGGFCGPRPPRDMGPGINLGTAKGMVKFFNGQKGFGFVVRDDGGEDVFVHISAVEQAGLTGLADGQPLEFTLTERNGRVSATDLVIDGEPMAVTDRAPPRDGGGGAGGGFGARNDGPRGGGYGGASREFGGNTGGGNGGGGGAPSNPGERVDGTVKFFNGTKGFGFIQREDGGPDAFVHISAVERAGMAGLNEGQRVSFELELDRRGKQAAINLSAL